MKRMKQLLGAILSICLLAGVLGIPSYAASGSFSISSQTATVGSTVTVTGKVTASEAIGAATINMKYDPSGLQFTGGSGDISGGGGRVTFFADVMGQNKTSITFSMSFKILKEGSFSVSLTSADVYTDATMDQVNVGSGSGTITGKAQTTQQPTTPTNPTNPTNPTTPAKDGNSKLSSLQVSPGALNPTFAAGTTTYTVKVPSSTTELAISAAAQSSKSRVSVSGGKNLRPGANEAKVTVVAENGNATVYILNIVCEDEIAIQIGGKNYTINEDIQADKIPTGFVKSKLLYAEREFTSLKSEKGEMQLLSLKNDTTTAFFIYDEVAKEFYPFTQVKFANGRFIIPMPLQDNVKEFEGVEQTAVTIASLQFDAWKLNDEYSVLCAMDSEGEMKLYQYDSVDGTLQRYAGKIEIEATEPGEEAVQDVADTTLEKVYKKGLAFMGAYYVYLIVGLGAALLIVSVAFICYAATRGSKHRAGKKRAQKRKSKKTTSVEQ